MRKLAGIITPCQSNAAATRFMRSPPAAKNVATTSTTTKARTAKGSRNASRGIGVPALRVLAARRARSIWARHNATEYESSCFCPLKGCGAVGCGQCRIAQLHTASARSRQPFLGARSGGELAAQPCNQVVGCCQPCPRPRGRLARPAASQDWMIQNQEPLALKRAQYVNKYRQKVFRLVYLVAFRAQSFD